MRMLSKARVKRRRSNELNLLLVSKSYIFEDDVNCGNTNLKRRYDRRSGLGVSAEVYMTPFEL